MRYFVCALVTTLVAALSGCKDQAPAAPESVQGGAETGARTDTTTAPSYPYTDSLVLTEMAKVPREKEILIETAEERWCYVPEWHDLFTMREKGLLEKEVAEKNPAAGTETPGLRTGESRHPAYRPYSPIIVYNQRSRKWYATGISREAQAVYPVKADPFDKDLIWFGCNDGPPGLHADYFKRAIPERPVPDAPLLSSGKPGGLGVLDIKNRTIRYYGPYAHLVGSRVYEIVFDKNEVYFWGAYPLAGEINGVSRYDRKTQTVRPIPLASPGHE